MHHVFPKRPTQTDTWSNLALSPSIANLYLILRIFFPLFAYQVLSNAPAMSPGQLSSTSWSRGGEGDPSHLPLEGHAAPRSPRAKTCWLDFPAQSRRFRRISVSARHLPGILASIFTSSDAHFYLPSPLSSSSPPPSRPSLLRQPGGGRWSDRRPLNVTASHPIDIYLLESYLCPCVCVSELLE